MQTIDDAMQQILIKSAARAGMQMVDRYCYSEQHVPIKELPKRVTEDAKPEEVSHYHDVMRMLVEKYKRQMMQVDGDYVCPRCQCQSWTNELKEQTEQAIKQENGKQKFYMLGKHSLIQDQNLKLATFENYNVGNGDDRANMQKAMQTVEAYKRGEQINAWLTGPPGVGKSWTAMSMLRELNKTYELSCLFIDVDEMLRKVRGTIKDSESIYTEPYMVDLVVSADFVVLDDLGAETGNIQTEKGASDFTSRILRAIVNGRQSKSTIITTNLTAGMLLKLYDPKLVDRLMRNKKVIKYPDGMPSKRFTSEEF